MTGNSSHSEVRKGLLMWAMKVASKDSWSSSSFHQLSGSGGGLSESSLRVAASSLTTAWETRYGQETKEPDEEQGEDEAEDSLEEGDDIILWTLFCPTFILLIIVGVCCSS